VEANGAAALVELDLDRNFAAKHTALLRIDFDVDVHALRANSGIESIARRSGGHRGFRFEVWLRSGVG